jgi:hypothetical protein
MPLTLGKGTIHPVLRSRYLDSGSKDRMRMLQHELMLEYAPTADLNLRLDIPCQNSRLRSHGGGHSGGRGRVSADGLMDITLRAKQRIGGSRGDGKQSQQSVFYGVKLPTGQDDHALRMGLGRRWRLDPIDQTGTGNPGVLAGYGWTQETLGEAVWASATWRSDVGGGFRTGSLVDLNGTYARWMLRPNEAEELGVKLSGGFAGQYHSADTRDGGSAGNEFGYLGLHLSPVVTQGNYIFQAGVFVPVVRSGVQHRVDFPYEIRFGIETYF